jgi:hypothetical protein
MIRQEQCDKVCRILDDVLANRPTERDSLNVAVRKAFDALEAHEGQRWIPITERLPLPQTLVWVTDSCLNVSACKLSYSGSGWYSENDDWIYFLSSVIAWMPYNAPEPYREGEQE